MRTAALSRVRGGANSPRSLRTIAIAVAAIVFGPLLVWGATSVNLDATSQTLLACMTIGIFLVCNRFPGRPMTVFLTVLSGLVSMRYIVWRFTETLDFETDLQAFLGTGLALAETYAIIVLALGYFQTIWPLERKPVPLPPDPDNWPAIDIYIPTYNESLDIVRATVLAALAMDWPRDRLFVYILDDGRRREFREFAESCGAGYIIRGDNAHAKAGNLNHAMTLTQGEFVVIFDCDHIPTRAFLQMTIGWLVRDSRIAFLQTPHHFYSPDPFQRNLTAGTRVPPEGNMFYGLVQDGNDFWDAAFFCGSCAVIRRTALESIGGFATETVTEDAHTALRLHRKGWQSAYLRLPLAGGLATERLILHVGQRVRWARGMLQIFRLDNPLLGPGLSIGQRLCYLNAMMHFFFALPRFVFLTSPLAFLLFDQSMIAASPLAIVSYALPHMFHSIATNSRIQQGWRHSFWSEIYETVLALFLLRITLVTMISPRRGRFNVTDKGGLLMSGYFDKAAVYPNVVLCLVLIAGLTRGVVGMLIEHTTQLQFQAYLMNTIWVTFSLFVVMGAVAVGRETRQLRKTARVRVRLPVTVRFANGEALPGICRNFSLGGAGIMVDAPDEATEGAPVELQFDLANQQMALPSQVVRRGGRFLHIAWQVADVADESRIVQLVFGRADAWVNWNRYPVDRPLHSLWNVLVSIGGLFRRGGLPPIRDTEPVPVLETLPRQSEIIRPRSLSRAASVLAFGLLAGMAAPAQAQPAPSTTPAAPPSPSPPAQSVPTGQSPPPAQPPAPAAAASTDTPSSGVPASDTRTVVMTLRDLGAAGPLALRGNSAIQGLLFGVRADEIVTDARLNLSGSMSPALLPDSSNVTVTLNEQYAGTIPVVKDHPQFGPLEMPVDPVFFQRRNRLNFRFTGRYTQECNEPMSGLLWATVSDRSTLSLTIARLPPRRDLSRLPLPFFDPYVQQKLVLPFVMAANPSNEALQGAAIAASWFGKLADFRGSDFPVSGDLPKEGNAVLIVAGPETPPEWSLPPISGPTIAEIANPNDPAGTILMIGGRTGAEVVDAANVLAEGSRMLTGPTSSGQIVSLPARTPYDAPAWLHTDRPIRFGELVDASTLQAVGYSPGAIHVPFRTAPDLYTWRRRPFQADVRYRSPPGPILDVAASRLDVSINDIFLRSYSLQPDSSVLDWILRNLDFPQPVRERAAPIPVYTVFAQNDLQLYFDARPLNRGDCTAVPENVRMAVDADSTLDLSSAHHFAELPNLTYFANSGFPFTRMADLSDTVVVLPAQPSAGEINAFLDLMGDSGAFTFQPVNRITVQRAGAVSIVPEKDLLLIGTLPQMGGAARLLERSPYQMQGNSLRVLLPGVLQNVWYLFGDRTGEARQKAAAALSAPLGETSAVLIGAPSPAGNGRSVVAVLGGSAQGLKAMVDAMRNPQSAPNIQGDLTILAGGLLTSYRSGPTYSVGELPLWLWPSWWLVDRPIPIVFMMLAATAVIGFGLYRLLRWKAARRVARLGAPDE